MQTTTAIIVWVYAALVILGGILGWVKARSRPSLVAGLVFGLALAVSGWAIFQELRGGGPASLVLAVLLLAVMTLRFRRTRKFMPAGLVAVVSALVAAWLVIALR